MGHSTTWPTRNSERKHLCLQATHRKVVSLCASERERACMCERMNAEKLCVCVCGRGKNQCELLLPFNSGDPRCVEKLHEPSGANPMKIYKSRIVKVNVINAIPRLLRIFLISTYRNVVLLASLSNLN